MNLRRLKALISSAVNSNHLPSCQWLHSLTGATSFPTTVRGEIAKPRRETDARRRAGPRRTGKYVEGLSDEPVGLATLGSGQACRSSRSAIAAEPSCAFEAGDLGEQDRREGERQAQEQLRDQQRAEVTIVGWRLNDAGGLITDFPSHDIDFVQVFGAKLAQRQGQICKRGHYGKEGSL